MADTLEAKAKALDQEMLKFNKSGGKEGTDPDSVPQEIKNYIYEINTNSNLPIELSQEAATNIPTLSRLASTALGATGQEKADALNSLDQKDSYISIGGNVYKIEDTVD
jgi:hypothetical protein